MPSIIASLTEVNSPLAISCAYEELQVGVIAGWGIVVEHRGGASGLRQWSTDMGDVAGSVRQSLPGSGDSRKHDGGVPTVLILRRSTKLPLPAKCATPV
ncbi:MAG: hypothetical protein SOH95_00035 [Bifidobacterium crudilactis]|nr:hypothetical protein [Bifidobacterium crudilactis]